MDEDIDNPKLLARIQRNIAEARAMNADFVVTPKLRNLVRQIRERNGDPVTERISLAPAPTPVADTEQVANLDIATTFESSAAKMKSFLKENKNDTDDLEEDGDNGTEGKPNLNSTNNDDGYQSTIAILDEFEK